MPTVGTKAKAKEKAKAKGAANNHLQQLLQGGVQHVNLQHTTRIHVGTTNLQIWTSIQNVNKENFNASYAAERDTLQWIAGNSNYGKINAIPMFSERLHELRLQQVHQFTMFSRKPQRLHRHLQHQ